MSQKLPHRKLCAIMLPAVLARSGRTGAREEHAEFRDSNPRAPPFPFVSDHSVFIASLTRSHSRGLESNCRVVVSFIAVSPFEFLLYRVFGFSRLYKILKDRMRKHQVA